MARSPFAVKQWPRSRIIAFTTKAGRTLHQNHWRADMQIAALIRKATAADAYIPLDMAEHQRRLRGCRRNKKPVPAELWHASAIREAVRARIPLEAVTGRALEWGAVLARWRAWKRVLDANPDYSVLSLAKVSGFDHTTILYAMKRLKDGACETSKPTGTHPPGPPVGFKPIPILVPKR